MWLSSKIFKKFFTLKKYAYEGMYRDCKKTCNQCPGCQNLGTDCPDRQKAGYCKMEVKGIVKLRRYVNFKIYLDLMRWQCKEACNMCNDMTPPKGIPIG